MKIFIDCDVLLDVGLNRKPFVKASGTLLDYLETKPFSAGIAWHSLSNVYYIAAKANSNARAKGFIADICQFLSVIPTDNQAVWQALKLPMKDFEDALQCSAALVYGAERIATRNTDDYIHAPIQAVTPETLLQHLDHID